MSTKVQIHDPGKLALFALMIVCASVLLGVDKIDVGQWALLMTGVFSYLTGNGLLAARGRISANVLGPRVDALTPPEAAALQTLARHAVEAQTPAHLRDDEAPPPP